jgi:predicted lipid-binding transport protein (Tim44 family)
MALSEHEQRVLDELERGLYAEDAKFATKVASGGNPARKLVAGALIAVVGLSVLVFAVIIQLMIIGLIAFALMLAGLVVATSGNSKPRESTTKPASAKAKPNKRSGGSFFEDRWDKRSDQ